MQRSDEPNFERLQFFAQRHRPSRMPIAHWHSQVEINYLADGDMTYLINGQLVRLIGTRMAVFWGATPHQVVGREGQSDLVVIYVPLGEFLRLRLPDDFRRRLMGGAFLVDQDADPADAILFPRWHHDLDTGRDDVKALVSQEVACRLWRFAIAGYTLVRGIDVASKPGHGSGDASMERVRTMAVFIAEHFAERLRIEDIARAAGIHAHYAMSLFRSEIGMTIHDYLTRQRMSHAQSMLIETDLPVSAIAEAA
ncbi:MAG: helix-turn-helix domain-containing protein, partial [Pseudomonadota bacterium]